MYCVYLRKSRADLELEAKGEMETLARHKKILLDFSKSMGVSIGIRRIYRSSPSCAPAFRRGGAGSMGGCVRHGG